MQPAGELLLVILGEGDKAGLFSFDGKQAPVQVQPFAATNDVFTGAASLKDGLVLFTQPSGGKFSSRYLKFQASGKTYVAGPLRFAAYPGRQRQYHHSGHSLADYLQSAEHHRSRHGDLHQHNPGHAG